MHFYGYKGPSDSEWFKPKWFKLGSAEAWIMEQDPNVWEIID